MTEIVLVETRRESIALDRWKPHPDAEKAKQGYVVRDHWRLIEEVFKELNGRLEEDGLARGLEYGFKWHDRYGGGIGPTWPAYRWIACYAVTGANEGHYVHVDVIIDTEGVGHRTVCTLGVAKTFEGWDAACELAAAVGKHLGA